MNRAAHQDEEFSTEAADRRIPLLPRVGWVRAAGADIAGFIEELCLAAVPGRHRRNTWVQNHIAALVVEVDGPKQACGKQAVFPAVLVLARRCQKHRKVHKGFAPDPENGDAPGFCGAAAIPDLAGMAFLLHPPGRPAGERDVSHAVREDLAIGSWQEVTTAGGGRSEIWRVMERTPANRGAVEPARLIFSTKDDEEPEYSPDGERIVFKSNRSGKCEIWVCNSDGSKPVQLTSNVGSNTFLPRWSPDGHRILFTSNPDGDNDLFVVDSQGGTPRRLTTDSSNEVAAAFSRDGRWIYFHSDRTDKKELWKMAADPERDGNAAVQVTKRGGISPEESPDGRFLYYLEEGEPRSLWRMPTGGGEEVQVLPSVHWGNFAVADDGIYFLTSAADGSCLLEFLDLTSEAVKAVSQIAEPGWGLTVTSGPRHTSRSILYVHARPNDSDLMLVEDFR